MRNPQITHLRARPSSKVKTYTATSEIPEATFGIVAGVLYIVIAGVVLEVAVGEPE